MSNYPTQDQRQKSTLNPDIWNELHADRKSLSSWQQHDLLQAAKQSDPVNEALCLLIYYTGCRLTESLYVRADHFCNLRSFIVLKTLKKKGHPWRAVPIPQELTEKLLALSKGPGNRLFPFSRWTARRRLKVIFEKAGVKGKLATSRSLRHTYDDRALNMPIKAKSTLLGHTPRINAKHYGDPLGYELTNQAAKTWRIPCSSE